MFCPFLLGSGHAGKTSHVLDDHAETTRAISGGRKAQDPGNTRDTGKTNRKANFSVALEHADTFF